MARGQWTQHSKDCQGEVLAALRAAGGSATMRELYQRGAWGIRTATLKALVRKGLVLCDGDVWRDQLTLKGDSNDDDRTT